MKHGIGSWTVDIGVGLMEGGGSENAGHGILLISVSCLLIFRSSPRKGCCCCCYWRGLFPGQESGETGFGEPSQSNAHETQTITTLPTFLLLLPCPLCFSHNPSSLPPWQSLGWTIMFMLSFSLLSLVWLTADCACVLCCLCVLLISHLVCKKRNGLFPIVLPPLCVGWFK